MACPICGAKCVCKKQGPGGLCCSCHRHTVRGKRLAKGSPELHEWRKSHGYDAPAEPEKKPEPEPAAVQSQQLDLFAGKDAE